MYKCVLLFVVPERISILTPWKVIRIFWRGSKSKIFKGTQEPTLEFLKKKEGEGEGGGGGVSLNQTTFHQGAMDIFWNTSGPAHATGVHERNIVPYARNSGFKKGTSFVPKHGKRTTLAQFTHI